MQTDSIAPARAPDRWTHEELDALPDDGMRYELLDGILLVSPSPVTAHQRAVARLWRLFDGACPSGFEAFVAPFDWRPDPVTSLEPDVLVVPQSALTAKNVTGIPVVVAEGSPPERRESTAPAKMSRYFDGGVGRYWLVDPGNTDPRGSRTGAARQPSIAVYDHAEDGYQLQASAVGGEEIAVTGIVTVTLRPADLVRPR